MSVSSNNRAAVLWKDLVRTATLTATSEAGNMVVENLITLSPRERWRSTSASDQNIIADAATSERWTMVYLDGTNFSEDATIRVRISDNSDLSSPSYDATFNAYVSVTGLGEGGLGEGGLGGTPIVDELQEWQKFSALLLDNILTATAVSATSTTLVIPKALQKVTGASEEAFDVDDYYIGATLEITDGTGSGQSRSISDYDANTRTLTVSSAWSVTPDNTSVFEIDLTLADTVTANDNTYTGRYFGVTISDNLNSDSYVQFGVLMAGDYFQPDIDIDATWEIGFVDPSERFLSYNYEIDINERTSYRTAAFTFSYLTELEADTFAVDMAAENGTRRPILFVPFYESSNRLYNNVIRGLLDASPRKQAILPDYTNSAYRVNLNIRGL